MPERNILVECEIILRGATTPEEAVEFLANEVGGQDHETHGGAIEICEFWVNEASTPKRVALDTAREEGWAEVLKAEQALREAVHRMPSSMGQQLILDVCTHIDYWRKAAAS